MFHTIQKLKYFKKYILHITIFYFKIIKLKQSIKNTHRERIFPVYEDFEYTGTIFGIMGRPEDVILYFRNLLAKS